MLSGATAERRPVNALAEGTTSKRMRMPVPVGMLMFALEKVVDSGGKKAAEKVLCQPFRIMRTIPFFFSIP